MSAYKEWTRNKMARKRTKTKDFGVSKRESHDSSTFYASRLYETIELNAKMKIVDKSKDFLKISPNPLQKHSFFSLVNDVPVFSVHLIILEVKLGIIESKEALNHELTNFSDSLKELYKKLITGGRIIVVVSNTMKKGNNPRVFYPLHAIITKFLLDQHFFLRGNIVLMQEQENLEQLPNSLSHNYKIAIIASKDLMKREKKSKKLNFEKTDTISKDEFLSATKSVWNPIQSNFSDVELIENKTWEIDYFKRLIQLYSFLEDNVLILKNDLSHDLWRNCQEIRKNCFFFNYF